MSRRRTRRPKPTTDTRSPEQRLEALIREPNPERAHRMLGRIIEDLEAKPEPGPWIAAARTLSERLIISEDAFYYLAQMFNESLLFAASVDDPELSRLRRGMEEIERAHGLREGEYWAIPEATDDWRELNDAWDRRSDELLNSSLRELEHGDLADLREQNPAEFEGRNAKGHSDIWGEDEESDD